MILCDLLIILRVVGLGGWAKGPKLECLVGDSESLILFLRTATATFCSTQSILAQVQLRGLFDFAF